MLNLLPPEQKKTVLLQYRLRVGVIVVVGFIVVLLVAIAFLIPTFLYSRVTAVQLEERKMQLEDEAKKGGRMELAEDLKRWQSLTTILNMQTDGEFNVADSAHTIEGEQTSAIAIDGFEFDRVTDDEKNLQITLSGVSRDRQSLFDFQKRLEGLEVFESVELPVSNFAENTNIDFSLTITLKDTDA